MDEIKLFKCVECQTLGNEHACYSFVSNGGLQDLPDCECCSVWKRSVDFKISDHMTNESEAPTECKKKPELMTLPDAWLSAKDGDIIKHLDGDLQVLKTQKSKTSKIEIGDIIEKRWEIIPAAPAIFTDEELPMKSLWEVPHSIESQQISISMNDFDKVALFCDKNGQLKQQIKMQPLIDAVHDFENELKEGWKHDRKRIIEDLIEIINNLKKEN